MFLSGAVTKLQLACQETVQLLVELRKIKLFLLVFLTTVSSCLSTAVALLEKSGFALLHTPSNFEEGGGMQVLRAPVLRLASHCLFFHLPVRIDTSWALGLPFISSGVLRVPAPCSYPSWACLRKLSTLSYFSLSFYFFQCHCTHLIFRGFVFSSLWHILTSF